MGTGGSNRECIGNQVVWGKAETTGSVLATGSDEVRLRHPQAVGVLVVASMGQWRDWVRHHGMTSGEQWSDQWNY